MAHYVIGADVINGNEDAYKQQLLDKVTGAGHTGEIIGTNPNAVQQFALSPEASGKICVQIAGGLCGFTAADMEKVVKFGGSSVANAGQFKKVADIIKSDKSERVNRPFLFLCK